MDMCVFDSQNDLLLALRAGNAAAFSHIYEKYAPILIDYAAERLQSLDEAHDMIHDLFVQLWEKKEQLEIKHSFKAFLFVCLKRRMVDHYRKNSYKRLYAERLQTLSTIISYAPDSYLEAKETQRLIDSSLLEMPSKVREIYLLSREEHLSNKEIASRLQISEQTVKNQLYTAMSILRREFRRIAIFILPFIFVSF